MNSKQYAVCVHLMYNLQFLMQKKSQGVHMWNLLSLLGTFLDLLNDVLTCFLPPSEMQASFSCLDAK